MQFQTRVAERSDNTNILELAIQSCVYGISTLRDIPNQAVQAAAEQSLKDLRLWISGYRGHHVIVAEEVTQNQFAGYLILDLEQTEGTTGETQSSVIDIAVSERFWGYPVSDLLVRAAAKKTHESGLQYMTAEITASNRRSYIKSLRLGFELERYQLAMHCGPNGEALPMPGRPENEKAHDVSRAQRRRLRDHKNES